MKHKENLFRLTFREVNTGIITLTSLLSGNGMPFKKSKPSRGTFNYLDYLQRKKAIVK